MAWLDFWNGDHAIYVNDRHREVHYRKIAEDVVALLPRADAVVLDFGPGDALFADRIAESCGRLILCEAANATRTRLETRFGHNAKITVLAPEDLQTQPERSVDLMLVNSVIQYLSATELDGLLAAARRLLAQNGRLIVADVIPPHTSAVSDAAALVRLARRHGFLAPALVGLASTFFSPYRRIRAELGLARFTEAQMVDRLEWAGFAAMRHRPNLGHNQARMAFEARPR